MELYTLDGLNGIKDIVETFQSVVWNMQFFGFGDFELVVPGTPKNFQILSKGTLLVRKTDISGNYDDLTYKNVMQIHGVKLDYESEKGWLLTLRGSGLKKMVGQRIVWAQTNLSGTVEDGIRQVLTDNLIQPTDPDRVIQDFVLAPDKGYTETIEAQLFGENIADWIQSTCELNGFGWDVYISGGKYVFDLVKGTDRSSDQSVTEPVIFSTEYDNLASSSYEQNAENGEGFANAALVGGEGEGTDKTTAAIGTASGMDRFERYIDGSGISSNGEIITAETYQAMLENFGAEELAGKSAEEKITGEILQNGMYILNRDYFLGDIVELKTEFYSAKSRITELIYSEDENGSYLIPTFGQWQE